MVPCPFPTSDVVLDEKSKAIRSVKSPVGTGRYDVEILGPEEIPEVLSIDAWEDLRRQSRNPDTLYQSALWWDHLCRVEPPDHLYVAVVNDTQNGAIVGVVPLLYHLYRFELRAKNHTLFRAELSAVAVLGSEPLVPSRDDVYERLVDSIWSHIPQCNCIYLRSVDADGSFARFLENTREIRKLCIVYAPEGRRTRHFIELPETFEQYLAKFHSRTRHTFRKQLRQLREHTRGTLELVRVDSEAQVEEFLTAVKYVSSGSWQHTRAGVRLENDPARCDRMIDLARRGVLRSYLLASRTERYAFMIGCQHGGVYHTITTGYDQALRQWSPGKILHYLLIEDLIEHDRPRLLNFDLGDMSYKELFGSVHAPDLGFLLLRKQWRNHLLVAGHASMRKSLGFLKRLSRRSR